jgi:ribonucleotide reductase alpha subunit
MLCSKYGINYEEVDMNNDEQRHAFYAEHNVNSMPQIFIDSERIGGYTELNKFFMPTYNYEELGRITEVVTRNLNKVIDINFYPIESTRRSNFKHRPIGIGVQGLADVFAMMNIPFDSDMSREINKNIFETIYYHSLKASMDISKERNEIMKKEILPLIDMESETLFGSLHKEEKDLVEANEICAKYNVNEFDLQNIISVFKDDTYQSTVPYITHHYGTYSSFRGFPVSQGKL